MLFRSRETPGFYERLRLMAWPRVSWNRSVRYFTKRVMRLTASPHAVAAGVAAGVFASATPFLGLHLIISFVVAYVVRGNMVAALLGSFVGNPVTLPIFWVAAYEIGNFILGQRPVVAGEALSHGLIHGSFDKIWPILKPTAIGSIPLGIAMGLVFYIAVRLGVQAYQTSRRRRLLERRSESGAEPG